MADRLIAPGVFTNENDLSFLATGISQIGGAFIGPTVKGPAFRPVIVESAQDYMNTFGSVSPDFYTPYSVTNYLTEASTATIVRVLGLGGYAASQAQQLVLKLNNGTASYVVGYIHPSRIGATLPSGSIASNNPTQFTLTISGSSGLTTYPSMSIDPTSNNYFANILGQDPSTKQDGYVYADFPDAMGLVSGSLVGSGSISLALAGNTYLNLSGSIFGTYSNASTPWIRSQTIGSVKYNLFQVNTISDGNSANRDVKVSISNIRPSAIAGQYGTFSLLVRAFDDTDSRLSVLEQYDNLTLDSTSTDFVGVRIGTQRTMIDPSGEAYLDGDFLNNSSFIFLELDSGLDAVPSNALPYGFSPLNPPVNANNVPAPSYITTRYSNPPSGSSPIPNNNTFYGLNVEDETTLSYLNPLPSGSVNNVGLLPTLGGDNGFDLFTSLATTDETDIGPITASNLRKFTVAFQGGFDGQNPAVVRATGGAILPNNTQGFDLSTSNADGSRAYAQAIQTLANPEDFDINLLVLPGVLYNQHAYVATLAIQMVESRGDCFYVMDSDILGQTVNGTVNAIAGIDTNYAATYHPWVKVRDTSTNQSVWVPPSVVMPQVYAFNDRVGAEWLAPAGLNRGGIGPALQVRNRLSMDDLETLYENKINPIKQINGQGIVVWGQKTLQQRSSALDRINVRRLMINVKKFFASTANYIVFEPNVDATRQRFLNIVNPYLANIQARFGLTDFRCVMSDVNNTPDLIDQNILVGDIYLKPTKAAEYIVLNFNILSTGAIFTNG